MTRALLAAALLSCAAGVAAAEPCAPAVTLDGDPALAASVRELLTARGIASEPAPACAAVSAELARRDHAIVIGIRVGDGGRVERVVSEPSIAATVIESFTRRDVGAPLLARRELPRARAPEADPAESSTRVRAPTLRYAETRGVHVFALVEGSRGSDRTSWLGGQLGACINLGPVCAAARLRRAEVTDEDGEWRELSRSRSTLFLGGDIPIAIGPVTLSPGFAMGIGSTRTKERMRPEVGRRPRQESGGFQAEMHATLSIPLRARFALDLALAGDFTGETHIESTREMPFPDEPRALLRFGIGLRYGGL